MAPKKIQICFLEIANVGGYMASGQWKRSDDTSTKKDKLKYYTDLARLADRGKISAIFFADWFVGFDVYGGGLDTMLKAGHQVAHMDPFAMVSAMAAVTENVSFAVTQSTTYSNPYVLARQYSTLDHITDGRCAWNIVTSFTKSSADALGHESTVPHDERYAIADEFMDVVYKLWESSWAPDSVVLDKTTGVAFDPEKIKKIEHKGKYFKMSGRNQVHPSPQRTPVLFQAGTSKAGSAFAAKHAEAIFLNTFNVGQAAKTVKEMRAAAAANGRDPTSIKFFPCFMPIIGKTREEAQAKHQKALDNADPVAGLAQFSGYTGIDLAPYPLDEPMDLSNMSQAMAIQAVFKALEASEEEGEQQWTPRRLGMRMALGGLHPCPVGTAEDVADVIQQWVEEADVDGFNIGSVTNPSSWEDVVDLLVPVLQERGLMWTEYPVPGGTFRENLMGTRELRDDHYGSSFKWGREKSQNGTKPSEAIPEAHPGLINGVEKPADVTVVSREVQVQPFSGFPGVDSKVYVSNHPPLPDHCMLLLKDVLAMAVKFIHHKGADNRPKPTIFFSTMTRRVILCPITIVISQALRDNAFHAPSLTCAARVFQIKNVGPVKCTPIRWKDSVLMIPLFRRFDGAVLSRNLPLQYHKLRDDMARQSLDAGEETAIGPKTLRRMAANAINGNAPDTVRDQAMRHNPKWATFNAAYINEMVEYHVQNAVLDEPDRGWPDLVLVAYELDEPPPCI
ncbi:hypothetical protein S40288_07039 [Stachybotrys chartarum IBT 40288]|nr:hypothetical protein S40288_07039 [Stachybotrys chartarum IBT 40288]